MPSYSTDFHSGKTLNRSIDDHTFDRARRSAFMQDILAPLRNKPTRPDCVCSQEFDIGVYDTCVFGCRYSYGSCNLACARLNFAKHDPAHPCLIP